MSSPPPLLVGFMQLGEAFQVAWCRKKESRAGEPLEVGMGASGSTNRIRYFVVAGS